ncbi:MAG: hypothetical protein E7503_06850 [Ruminococcus sp.]|nr:hypothetical protein [Ruminococcus sp.]
MSNQQTKNPGKFKKISLIILIVVAAVVIGTALMVLYLRTFQPELFDSLYYGRVYFGNRNIGTVTVNVDGQAYTLTEDNFTMAGCDIFRLGNSGWDALTVREDGSAKVELAAGDKGYFGYAMTVDGLEYPLVFKFGHNPCWTVITYDLTVNVDTTQNIVTCEGYCTENGDKVTISEEAWSETIVDEDQTYLILDICSVA